MTMTNGHFTGGGHLHGHPSSEIGGYLNLFQVFKLASKGSLWSGLPRRVRKVGVEGKVSRDVRAARLSSLAVLPAAGGGSCEALARWPAPRFNPGFLICGRPPASRGGGGPLRP